MTISDIFLQIYGSNLTKKYQNQFEKYQDIILQSTTNYIKKTQAEIAEISDPQ
jgi:hypothetical protein